MAIQGKPAEKYQIEYEHVFTIDEASSKATELRIRQIGDTTKVVSGEDALLRIEKERLANLMRLEDVRARTSVIMNTANIVSGEEALLRIEKERRVNLERIEAVRSKSSVVGNAAKVISGEEALLRIEKARLGTIEKINAEKHKPAPRAIAIPTEGGIVSSGDEAANRLAERRAEAVKKLARANELATGTFDRLAVSQNAAKNKGKALELAMNGTTSATKKQIAAVKELEEAQKGLTSKSFLGKISNTAQYAAAAAGIFAVTNALREGAIAVVEFDTASRTLAAVIQDLSVGKARVLEKQLIDLGQAFGSTVEEINKSAILLGRAGIAQEDLIKSTEVVIKLSKITGDTLDSTSGALISYIEVFSKAGETVESLADKLAFMANESRLSTQDIETFSNFALAAADAAGLTVDAVAALATQFSKAGVNASTIGTQIRSLTKVFLDSAPAIGTFFNELGIVQGNFQEELAAGGVRSNKALVDLGKKLASLTRQEFNRVTSSMDILQRNSLALLRQQAEGVGSNIKTLVDGAHDGIAAADVILSGYVANWERLKAGVASTVVGLDEFLHVSGAIDSVVGGLATSIQLMETFFNNGTSAANDFIRREKALSNATELNLKLEELKESAATAGSASRLKAYEKEIKATEKLLVLEKQKIVIAQRGLDIEKGVVDDTAAKNIERAEEAIRQQENLVKSLTKAKNATNESGGAYSVLSAQLEKAKLGLKSQVDANEKLKVSYDELKEGRSKYHKEVSKTTALTANSVEITKGLTSAVLDLAKAGEITAAKAGAPFEAINSSVLATIDIINKITSSDAAGNIFDGINTSATTTSGILKTHVELLEREKGLQEELVGANDAQTLVINKKIRSIQSVRKHLKSNAVQATEIERIHTAINTAVIKEAAETLKVVDAKSKLLLVEEKSTIKAGDKVSIAEAELHAANRKVQAAFEGIRLDEKGIEILETKLAFTNALREAESKSAIVVQEVKNDQIFKDELKFTAELERKKAELALNTFSIISTQDSRQTAVAVARLELIDDRIAKEKELQEQIAGGQLTDPEAAADIQADITREYEAQDALLVKQSQSLDINFQIMTRTADLLGNQLGNALFDMTQGVDSWKDAAEGFRQGLIKIALQLLIIQPLVESLKAAMAGGGGIGGIASSFFASADGNVITGSGPDKRYATGGIVRRPT